MRYLFILLLPLITLKSVIAQDISVGDSIYVHADTYLRSAPNLASKNDTVATVSAESKGIVEQISTNELYYKIKANDKTGWVFFSHVISWARKKETLQREKEMKAAAERREKHVQF